MLDTGLISSLDTVLLQEMEKFNRLLLTMTSTLVELEKAIKGLVVMSLDLDKMYSAFMMNEVRSTRCIYLCDNSPLGSSSLVQCRVCQ